METFGAATVGTLGRGERSHNTSDGRHDTSDASYIVARTALLGCLLWSVSSPILALSIIRESDRSVRRSPCSASPNWAGWGHHNSDMQFCKILPFSADQGKTPHLLACVNIFICSLYRECRFWACGPLVACYSYCTYIPTWPPFTPVSKTLKTHFLRCLANCSAKVTGRDPTSPQVVCNMPTLGYMRYCMPCLFTLIVMLPMQVQVKLFITECSYLASRNKWNGPYKLQLIREVQILCSKTCTI